MKKLINNINNKKVNCSITSFNKLLLISLFMDKDGFSNK